MHKQCAVCCSIHKQGRKCDIMAWIGNVRGIIITMINIIVIMRLKYLYLECYGLVFACMAVSAVEVKGKDISASLHCLPDTIWSSSFAWTSKNNTTTTTTTRKQVDNQQANKTKMKTRNSHGQLYLLLINTTWPSQNKRWSLPLVCPSVSMLYKPKVFCQILNPLKLFQNLTCWLFRGAKQRNICFVPNLVGRIFSHKQSESELLSLCRWELFWTGSLLGHTDRWRCLTYGIGGWGCGHQNHHHHQHDQHHQHRHCHLHPHQSIANPTAGFTILHFGGAGRRMGYVDCGAAKKKHNFQKNFTVKSVFVDFIFKQIWFWDFLSFHSKEC